jgi:hypothetical protein
LEQALAVTQVDEDHATMIAATLRPAGDSDGLTDQGLTDLAAIVSTHNWSNELTESARC